MIPVPSSAIATPRRGPYFAHCFALAALLLLASTPLFARNPQPVNRIPLEPLGFQPLITRYMLAGSSMLTLHYVDDTHLLLTFSSRRLIKRIPGDPPGDQDRIVDALLLDLPSGHILARTEWRLHDHGQYLFSIGHGQFLLRVKNLITLIAPLANLKHGDPFAERPFLHTSRQIIAVLISPTSDLLTLETVELPPVIEESSTLAPTDAPSPKPRGPVQINFYRLSPPVSGRDYVIPRSAGVALSRAPVELPLNATGYVHILDQGHSRWAFDFNSHSGKVLQLALYDSTCRPYPILVSAGEFITFGCRGGGTRQQLAAFNLRGDEMWEQTLSGTYLSPNFAYAPAVGRFALSRLLVVAAAINTDTLSSSEVTAQNVDVYQIESGKQLLHLESSPIARAGQNFAFSPDGLNFAITHDGAIEIYRLPPLSAKDQAAIQLAAAAAPEPNEVPVDLSETVSQQEKAKKQASAASQTSIPKTTQPSPEPQPPIGTPAQASPEPQQPIATPAQPAPEPHQPQAPPAPSGDAPPDQPRQPPTLYNPGESKSQ